MSPRVTASLCVVLVYVLTAALHVILPGQVVLGYACDTRTGRRLSYKLNGLAVLLTMLGMFASAVACSILPGTIFYDEYYACCCTGFTCGLIATAFFYVRGSRNERRDRGDRCPTWSTEASSSNATTIVTAATFSSTSPLNLRIIRDIYNGLEFNPRLTSVDFDVKMWLYVAGAVMLQLNLCSAFLASASLRSPLLLVYHACFAWFVTEYLYFEHVHLYTYDLFAEKVGFKLLWGCLFFYPFFYPMGARYVVGTEDDESFVTIAIAIACACLFLCGWIMTRGANLQKFACKIRPCDETVVLFGGALVLPQRFVGGRGARRKILRSGFWGLARHLNYAGEITQALALAVPPALVSGSLVPFSYPLYYLLLFVDRVRDDDEICERKYGKKLWGEYRQAVRWKMIPGLW